MSRIATRLTISRPLRNDGAMTSPHGKKRFRRSSSYDSRSAPPRASAGKGSALLRLRQVDGGRFALLSPPCALERAEDLVEVREMIGGGELEIARDELLYLVADCRAFLEAHTLLGELALEEGEIALARGHFGFAYEVGLDSLPPGFQGQLPAKSGCNAAFLFAGRGLARCLIARGNADEARRVLKQLLCFDSHQPEVRALLTELDEREKSSG